jgi:hypothetical protein
VGISESQERAEIRHVQPLQPLQMVVADRGVSSEETDSSSHQSIELDRRRALLSNIAREPRRKVITGGHTRKLSLLSPDRSNYTQPFPMIHDSRAENKDGRRCTNTGHEQGYNKDSSKTLLSKRCHRQCQKDRRRYEGGIMDVFGRSETSRRKQASLAV